MRCDSLGLTRSLEHKELREDGDGLEVDAEGPEGLLDRVPERGHIRSVVEDESQ